MRIEKNPLAAKLLRTLLLIVVLCVSLTVMSFALEGKIDTDVLNVRSETSVKSEKVGRVTRGTAVEITGRVGNWYSIDYKGKRAFLFVDYVTFDQNYYVDIGYATVKASTGATVNMRAEPSTDGERITRLLAGTKVRLLGYTDGWYYIRFSEYAGYLSADYIKLLGLVYGIADVPDPNALDPRITEDLPNSRNYATIEETINPADVAAALKKTTTSERAKIVEYAMGYIGVKYVYGGTSPTGGFDCSGFTQYVFKHFGYSLNRSSAAQINNGTKITKEDLLPGDLVFFSRAGYSIGHVGIYIGDGNFVHASSPGDYVKITSLDESYYANRYVGSRRIVD